MMYNRVGRKLYLSNTNASVMQYNFDNEQLLLETSTPTYFLYNVLYVDKNMTLYSKKKLWYKELVKRSIYVSNGWVELDVRLVGIDLKLFQCIQNTNGRKFSLIVIIKYSIIVQWKIFHSLVTSYCYLLTWLKIRILILKCKKKLIKNCT